MDEAKPEKNDLFFKEMAPSVRHFNNVQEQYLITETGGNRT